jgi:hypothetical protein
MTRHGRSVSVISGSWQTAEPVLSPVLVCTRRSFPATAIWTVHGQKQHRISDFWWKPFPESLTVSVEQPRQRCKDEGEESQQTVPPTQP